MTRGTDDWALAAAPTRYPPRAPAGRWVTRVGLPARASRAVRAGAAVGAALALQAAGAGLFAAAPRWPVAWPAGAVAGPAVGVWPLLMVLAVAPVAVAVLLVVIRQRAAALAVLAATGAVAAGRSVLDLMVALQPAAVARPELLVVTGIGAVRPGPAGWLLVAGQLCTVAAGVLATVEVGRCRGEHSIAPPIGAARVDVRVPPAALGCAGLAAVGLLAPPFGSATPFLPARSVLDAPPGVTAGGVLLAAALVLATVLAASAPDHRVVAGGLVGVGLATGGVALPSVVVAALAPGLWVSAGPVLAVLGALGLCALARSVVRRAWAPGPTDQPGATWGIPRTALADRFRRTAGVLCALAGGCAVAAFLADPVRLAGDQPPPRLPTVGLLLATGLVVAAVGLVVAASPVGRLARPGLAVVASAMPMAAAEQVTAVLAVLELPGVDAGPGWWLAVAAVAAALAGALSSVLAGGFERDEVDLSERPFHGPTAAPAAAAAVLAVPAFLLPLVDGAGHGVTGVFQAPYGLPSWALLGGMAVTAGVGLLGPRCRPARAAVLYIAACLLLVLRLARIPCGPRPLPSAGLAEGAVATVLCLVLLLVAATLAVSAGQSGLSSAEPVARAEGGPDRAHADSGGGGQGRPGRP